MPLVMGVDSSTQSCKVVVRDAVTGELVRHGRAAHPEGTEVAPSAWEDAARAAIGQAGGLADIAALSVGGQQHGMVCLDERGEVVRPALLWNDTRSARAAAFRADPEVIEAMAAAKVAQLSEPTLSADESYAELLADPSSFESFDAVAAGKPGAGFVRLNQLALEHLLGAR